MTKIQPRLHLVGGFLGAGKTTAIIRAAKRLMQRGLRVGVVTNDQGKYLVDTAFFRLSDLPTVEVTGGCFCCNYNDLNQQLRDLIAAAQPDVIFSESVGSCADLVATVIKPLLSLGDSEVTPFSFSVFADARLLLRRVQDDDLPFSEDVIYIFDQQIAEAGMVIVNKIDLLNPAHLSELEAGIAEKYAGKPYHLQSSLVDNGVDNWVDLIESGGAPPPIISGVMDYVRYGAGEAQMAWFDQDASLMVQDGSGRAIVIDAIHKLLSILAANKVGIGHLKFIISARNGETKVSIPTLEEPGWEDTIPDLAGDQVDLLINARVEAPSDALAGWVRQALDSPEYQVEFGPGEAFHPKQPKPTHRIA